MAVGLRNEATLAIKVTLEQSKGVAQVKTLLKELTAAFKAQTFQKQTDLMEKSLADLKGQLKSAKNEISALNKALNLQQAAMAKVYAQNRKNAGAQVQANSHVKAYQQSLRQAAAVFAAFNVQQQNAAARQRALAAAAQGAAAIQKVQAAQVQRQAQAQQQLNNVRRFAGNQLTALQRAELALVAAQRMGEDWVYRNVRAINAVRNARQGDEKALRRYTDALIRTIQVSKTQEKMRRGGSFLGVSLSFLDQMRERVSEFEHRMDALFRASLRLNITGMTLRRWSDNILRFGADIMQTFGEFEYTMLRAAGALEIWLDAEQQGNLGIEELQRSLLDLTNTMVLFPAEEVAEALYFWGSATGQIVRDTEELEIAMSGLERIMQAAAMTNTDYETTIKGVYSILTQFYGGSLEYADEVTEKLFLTTQKTAAEFNDLIQSFKMVGPVAAQVGTTFDEVNMIFGKLADLGLRGSLAGRGLRQFFIQMVRPSGPAQKAIDQLFADPRVQDLFDGKTFREVAFPDGQFVGIIEHVNNLAQATMHLNEADRLQFLARISTANQLPLLVALVAQQRNEINGLADDYDKLADADPSEFFRRNWEALAQSWNAVIGGMQRAIETVKITLGGMIKDTLTPLIDNLKEFTNQVRVFIETHPGLVKFVVTFAAIAAAVLAVAGVLFVAVGTMIGLGASIYLVVRSTDKWHGAILGLLGVLSLMISAIIRNFDYIRTVAISVVESLTKAWDNLAATGIDLNDVIAKLVAPINTLMDILVLVIGESVKLIAEFIRMATEINKVIPVVDALVLALQGFVIFKIASALLAIAAGYKAVVAAVYAGRIVPILVAVQAALAGITSAGIVGGLGRLALGIRAVGAAISVAMGPIGWAALAATVAVLAFTNIPVLSDWLDTITTQFRDLNGELAEATGYFGDAGGGLETMAAAYAKSVGEVEAAQTQLESVLDQQADLLNIPRQYHNESDEAFSERFQRALGLVDPNDLWDVNAELDKITRAGTAAIQDGNEAKRDVLLETIDFVAEWTQAHKDLSARLLLDERDFKISAEDYGKGLIAFSDNIVDKSQVDEFLDNFLTFVPDKVTPGEAVEFINRFNSIFASLGQYVDISEGLEILGNRVGEESSLVTDQLIEYVVSLMALEDPAAMREAMYQPLAEVLGPEFAGETILSILDNNEFSGAQTAIRGFLERYWSVADGGDVTSIVAGAKESLKRTVTNMTEQVVMAAIPDLTEMTQLIEAYAADMQFNGPEALVHYLLEPYGDTTRIGALIAQEGLAEDGKEIAQMLVDLGIDEFQPYIEQATEAAGEAAGEAAKTSYIEGLTDALGEGLSVKDLRDLGKMGTISEQVGKMFRDNRKLRKVAFGKNQNAQTRQAYMEMFKSELKVATRAIDESKNFGQRSNRTKQFLKALLPDLKRMPKQEKEDAFQEIIDLGKVNPSMVMKQIKKALPEGSDMRKRLLGAILAPGVDTAEGGDSGVVNPLVDAAAKSIDALSSSPIIQESADAGGQYIGKEIMTGFDTSMTAENWSPHATTALTAIKNAMITGEANGNYVKGAAESLARTFALAFKNEVHASDGTMSTGMGLAMGAAAATARTDAQTYGNSVGSAWATGFKNGLAGARGTISVAFAESAKDGKGGSPPKTGPLRHIDQWGKNVGMAWSGGLADGIRGSEAFQGIQRDMDAFTGRDIMSSSKREVVVKIEVSSPDGTVDRQKQSEVRRATLEALTIAGIEHVVTVG